MFVRDLFPETDLIQCTFAWRTSSNQKLCESADWDDYDHHRKSDTLKKYIYRLPPYLKGKVSVGDTVVVHCQTGYQVCQVVEINTISNFKVETFASVVAKVDMREYIGMLETQKAMALMKQKIDAEKKRLESMVTYELIAERNPEFKAMLEKYKAMGGEF